MIERALVLAILTVAVAAAVILARWWLRRGLAGLRTTSAEGLWSALGTAPDGRPSLVVFSTPSCTVCRTAQYPAVETVEATYGSALRVLRVDLSRQPAAATAFKVLTAPSTALLGGDGRVSNFNHGFAPAEQLAAQLSALGASPVSPR
ncbi:MAG: thioredoxin family protein [Chloroflexi bacterium]|nr:MAG: thioredoxin family protein [Chloroflexota bacterium]